MKVLGIDIGGTNIRMGVVDENFELTNFERCPCQQMLGDEHAVPNLITAIQEYLDRVADKEIAAISVGIPGQVSRDKSFVYSVPQVHGLENTDLGKRIEAAVGLPAYVGHDVDYLLAHDINVMSLDPNHSRTILGFYLGTGLGNALYINGSPYSGKHGVAGELGHIPLYGVTDVCNCGGIGCTETRCCGGYLAKLVAEEFPDCHIGDIFVKHGDDPRIIKVVKDFAIPLATEITILDPDFVVIGGGLPMMPGFPKEMLENEIRLRSRHPLPADDLHFYYASDSQANGVIGGAMTVMDWIKQSN